MRRRDEGLLAFVGKGIHLIPAASRLSLARTWKLMKYDMSGGATVMGAMRAIGAVETSDSVSALSMGGKKLLRARLQNRRRGTRDDGEDD